MYMGHQHIINGTPKMSQIGPLIYGITQLRLHYICEVKTNLITNVLNIHVLTT